MLFGGTLLLLLLAAAIPATGHERDEDARLEESIRRGAETFRRACAACHGPGGRGDGPGADDLDPRPRDLTSRQYRFRSTPNGELPRPEDLERTIRRGLPGADMPAFGDLFSRQELDDLIHFVYSLQTPQVFDGSPPAALPPSPVPPPTPSSQRDGRALYAMVGCWRCHGVSGAGNGPAGRTTTDEDGRRLRPTDFRYDPFKGGRTPEDVVRALRTGLNGTAMPSYDEAMLISSEDPGDTASLGGRLDESLRSAVEAFRESSPTPQQLAAMDAAERAALRDRRLADLAYYVLSLERRRGAGYRLFRERPERELRETAP